MNGNTLRWAFSVIVWTYCIILISSTFMVFIGKMPTDSYKDILGNLGIIGLFTMIAQTFLHIDANKDGIPDHQQVIKEDRKDEKNVTVNSNPVNTDDFKG